MIYVLWLQIYVSHDTTVKSKLRRYFNDNWNIFDSVIFALFVLCIILRCTLPFERFQWARRLYAINLIMFYVRFLHTFYVHKNIGPKVIMIFQMVRAFLLHRCVSHQES